MTNSADLSFFQDKHVLVTGGAGFVGSHLCERLLQLGAQVIAVDNFITGQAQNIEAIKATAADRLTFIEADVSLPPDQYLPANQPIDVVLHFASPASPPRYQAHPVETYSVNSFGTHYLLQYLLKNHPQARFLFASTSEIYGNPQIHPQTESYWGNVNPNGIRSCYDEAKRLGETICGVHQRDFKLDVRIVRIFNTYGPRMDLEDGRVIPNFIKEALEHKPLSIYGDGTQTRSYCYVTDLVEGILSLAAHTDGNGQTLNLGNPGEYTVLETAKVIHQLVAQMTGQTSDQAVPELSYHPLPKDDPLKRKPDISRATQLLGWQPSISLQDGLQKTIAYFMANAHDKKTVG
jgi:nucleoside-diphosphate-sugar epimerase